MTRKHKLKLNGREVSPEEFHRGGKVGGEGIPMITRPYLVISESMGVLPHQVQEARESEAYGRLSGVEILDNGAAKITSQGEMGRIGLMRLRGNKVDGDGCYGDTYEPRQ